MKRYLDGYINNDYRDYVPDIIKRSRVVASQNQIYHYSQKELYPRVEDPVKEKVSNELHYPNVN